MSESGGRVGADLTDVIPDILELGQGDHQGGTLIIGFLDFEPACVCHDVGIRGQVLVRLIAIGGCFLPTYDHGACDHKKRLLCNVFSIS